MPTATLAACIPLTSFSESMYIAATSEFMSLRAFATAMLHRRPCSRCVSDRNVCTAPVRGSRPPRISRADRRIAAATPLLAAILFGQKVRPLPRSADGNGVITHQALSCVIALRDDRERECQHERRQAKYGAGNGGDCRLLVVVPRRCMTCPSRFPSSMAAITRMTVPAKMTKMGMASVFTVGDSSNQPCRQRRWLAALPVALTAAPSRREALLRRDAVVRGLGRIGEGDLHPPDLAIEPAGVRRVVRADGGAGIQADVGRLSAEKMIACVCSTRPLPTSLPST